MTVSVTLCPSFGVGYQSFTDGGLPNNAGYINTYIAGGTTPQATYTSASGSVQNDNPITMTASGRLPSEVWLIAGQTYRFDVFDALGNLLGSYDNIDGDSGILSANNIFTGDNVFTGFTTFNDVLINGDLTFGVGATIDGEAYTDLAFLSRTQSFRKAQRGTIATLTDAATITPDFSAANNYQLTIAGDRTLANPTNMPSGSGQSGIIAITQGSGGNHTLAYGTYWNFTGSNTPVLSTVAGSVDYLAYYVSSSTFIGAKLLKAFGH